MNQALFVGPDRELNLRIRNEFGPQAIVASTMNQAISWVSNPDLTFSAIYLNPNGASFSALRFLETVLLERPATPIYLIDEFNEVKTPEQLALLECMNIKGVWNQSAPELFDYPELAAIRERRKMRSAHPSFLAIPIVDFVHSKHYSFDVFVEDATQKLILFATAGSPIEPEYLSHVAQKSAWLYVSEAQIHDLRQAIKKTGSTFMKNESFPQSWKTAEALYQAKLILQNIQSSGPNDDLVEDTHFALGDLFHLISELNSTEKLQKLIEQAKDSDRNIACATLSIMMCKSLKFEKSAIVEILGLASFFQDVSLYQTPFGNLSGIKVEDLSKEQAQHYHQHPLMSADIIALHTSVPDVTLQVIRQHHERKDRTGFPNRIGGMQLHPMAEVLSLINAYLDYADRPHHLETEVYLHYSDRMVNAFKNILKVSTAQAKLAA